MMQLRNIGGLALLLCLIGVPAWAQEGDAPAAPAEAGGDAGSPSTVDQILREQESLLRGRAFSYRPENRRDPFRPLVTSAKTKDKGDCRSGINCMGVAELDLSGIVQDRGGEAALVMGPDNRGYFLRAGDKVFDATVISVDARRGTVTFRQRVDDPRRIKPYRDVTKRLNPSEGETIP